MDNLNIVNINQHIRDNLTKIIDRINSGLNIDTRLLYGIKNKGNR
jgi:hypothetical protein